MALPLRRLSAGPACSSSCSSSRSGSARSPSRAPGSHLRSLGPASGFRTSAPARIPPTPPHTPRGHHPTGWRKAPQASAASLPLCPRTAPQARRQPRSPQAGPLAARALPRRTRPPPTLAAAQAQAAGAEALCLHPRAARRPLRPPRPAVRLVLGVRHLPHRIPAAPRAPQARHPPIPTRLPPEPGLPAGRLAPAQAAQARPRAVQPD